MLQFHFSRIFYVFTAAWKTDDENGSFQKNPEKVGTYEGVDVFLKMKLLIGIWLPNPLRESSKYIKRLQKNCLKVSIYLVIQKLEALETYSPV